VTGRASQERGPVGHPLEYLERGPCGQTVHGIDRSRPDLAGLGADGRVAIERIVPRMSFDTDEIRLVDLSAFELRLNQPCKMPRPRDDYHPRRVGIEPV
jgi:hypothetical protein